MMNLLLMLLNDKRGATAIEYGLICAMVVLAIVAALSGFASASVDMWTLISTKVTAN